MQEWRHTARQSAPDAPPPRRPIGRVLVEMGVISPGQLVMALHLQHRHGIRIGQIIVAEGWATQQDVLEALARQSGLARVDPLRFAPDAVLVARMPARFWLRHRLVPWRRDGARVLIATDRPDLPAPVRALLADLFGAVQPVLAEPVQIQSAIAAACTRELAEGASERLPDRLSCRTWGRRGRRRLVLGLGAGLAVLVLLPGIVLSLASAAAMLTLLLFLSLRATGAIAHLLSHRHLTAAHPPAANDAPPRLPRVSVMVPLYREKEIAGALVRRLTRLTYPKALLEVLLVLEEHDDTTRRALARAKLPPWMRLVEVPAHRGLTTKPRAMNYALDFCRGELIGVWDAEDAPAPDQIERFAARFAEVPEEVACIQGILDYYNPRTNWRARCFTIEYASWFRVILPGIARLGLVVPLGGTTHFFRRRALETVGGWDAHNVT